MRSVASAVVGVAAAGAFLASPAFADGGYPIYGDGGFKDEVHFAPPPITWAGFYIGLHAGYGWADSDWKALEDIPPVLAGDRFSHDPEGGLFGGHIGYNAQTGPVVWGIEARFQGPISTRARARPSVGSSTRLRYISGPTSTRFGA